MKEEKNAFQRKAITETQAIWVMGIGGFLFLLAILIHVPQGTPIYAIKIVTGIIGF